MTLTHPRARAGAPAFRFARIRQRFSLLTAVVLMAAFCTAGCSNPDPGADTQVTVTGPVGEVPDVQYATPLTVPKEKTTVIWPGTGEKLIKGKPALLNLYAQDGRNHKILQNTYVSNPQWLELSNESAGPGITEALEGQKAGARVLYFEQDGDTPMVLVIDVVSTRAKGEAVAPAAGLPAIDLADPAKPVISVPKDAAAPDELVVQPLIRGTGRQINAGDRITVRYVGARWTNGAVFDSNWAQEPETATIGVGSLNEGWDQGIPEQTVGSRLLLVVPPELGYLGTESELAGETLIYVVDILAASSPAKTEPATPVPAASADPQAPTVSPADATETAPAATPEPSTTKDKK